MTRSLSLPTSAPYALTLSDVGHCSGQGIQCVLAGDSTQTRSTLEATEMTGALLLEETTSNQLWLRRTLQRTGLSITFPSSQCHP